MYIDVGPVGGATSQSDEAERKQIADEEAIQTEAAAEVERKRIADEEAARTKAADEAERKVLF